MSKMIIRVGSGGDGEYFVSRSFVGMDLGFDPPGTSFKLEQQDSETREQLEERVCKEARRRGITHVNGLD